MAHDASFCRLSRLGLDLNRRRAHMTSAKRQSQDKSRRSCCHVSLLSSPLMACISFFSRLRRSRKRDTEAQNTDPTVPPRPESLQLGFGPPESTPPPLRRQKSEGKQRMWSIRFDPAHIGSFGRNRWNSIANPIRLRPSPPRPQCR